MANKKRCTKCEKVLRTEDDPVNLVMIPTLPLRICRPCWRQIADDVGNLLVRLQQDPD